MAGKLKTTVRIGGRVEKGYYETIRGSQNAVFGRPNNPIYARATGSRMGAEIAAKLIEQAVFQPARIREFENEQRVQVAAIKQAANTEARRLIDFVTTKMIGMPGGVAGVTFKDSYFRQGLKNAPNWKPAFPMGGSIEWQQLGRRYMHLKGNQNFFANTGELKGVLRGMRSSYPDALGGIRVTSKEYTRRGLQRLKQGLNMQDTRRVALGTITIEIFPNASPNLFPGLSTGRWDQVDLRYAALEASTFFPANIREKLSGPRKGGYAFRFRPMMGPATQFWMMHRIPSAIATAIANGTRTRSQMGYQRPSRDAMGMPVGRGPSAPRRI